jgi:hypothetical protein
MRENEQQHAFQLKSFNMTNSLHSVAFPWLHMSKGTLMLDATLFPSPLHALPFTP